MNFAPPKNDAPTVPSQPAEKLLTPDPHINSPNEAQPKLPFDAPKLWARSGRQLGLPILPFDSPKQRARSGQNFALRNFGGGGVARRALCALSRAQSRGTPNEEIFLFVTPALQLVLACARRRQRRMLFSPHQLNRTASGGPSRASALVVLPHTLRRIIGNADVKRIIGTAEDVAVIHKSGR